MLSTSPLYDESRTKRLPKLALFWKTVHLTDVRRMSDTRTTSSSCTTRKNYGVG